MADAENKSARLLHSHRDTQNMQDFIFKLTFAA